MIQRWRILIQGIVQGVGFRPHVARMAARFSGGDGDSVGDGDARGGGVACRDGVAGADVQAAPRASGKITGFVGNDDVQVFIEVQGDERMLRDFLDAVTRPRHLPPLARITSVTHDEIPCIEGESDFRIVQSQRSSGARTLIPPDVATCPDCLADMADQENRRYGYAFTTCTNCGPRLSIIEDVPYDRPFTTMRDFPMCPDCRREYSDPLDRRYHAQPISCYACGPHLWIVESSELGESDALSRSDALSPDSRGQDPFAEASIPQHLIDGSRGGRDKASQDAALAAAREALREGKILALKGIGGFHLMVNASDPHAIERLRRRKHRDGKPFAVMVRGIEEARAIVDIGVRIGDRSCGSAQEKPAQEQSSQEQSLQERAAVQMLTSIERPIVVLPRVQQAGSYECVSDAAAPGLRTLGIMLPYSPLHQLLLDKLEFPVIATSGNLSNEPLCYTNEQTLARLAGIADVFLLHNRDIAVPVEDSVVQANNDGSFTPIRRSRGYAPLPIALHAPIVDTAGKSGLSHLAVLGLGGELKNTFTLVRDGMAFMSAHIGDMGSLESQQAYQAAMGQMAAMHREQPAVIVHDAHPNYATTAWAQRYAERQEKAGTPVTLLPLQHHRAHALALVAEHLHLRGDCENEDDLTSEPIIVAALDGTGYGDDGAIWGSEIFCVDLARFFEVNDPDSAGSTGSAGIFDSSAVNAQSTDTAEMSAIKRLWHLPYFQLVGGDKAVKEPWRLGVSMCAQYGIDLSGLVDLHSMTHSPAGRAVLKQLDAGAGVPVDSVGRYFDAVSAMLGLCRVAEYEAQAAVALQEAAQAYCERAGREVSNNEADSLGAIMADREPASIADIVCALVQAYKAEPYRETVERCAYEFHQGLAGIIADKLSEYARYYGTKVVGVTGGSAVNSLLTELIVRGCGARGLRVLRHRTIPANDGGLSLGQAYYGWLRQKVRGAKHICEC